MRRDENPSETEVLSNGKGTNIYHLLHSRKLQVRVVCSFRENEFCANCNEWNCVLQQIVILLTVIGNSKFFPTSNFHKLQEKLPTQCVI